MQKVVISGVDSFFLANGISMDGGNEQLTDKLLQTVEIDSWCYSEGELTILVPDGVQIPDMSAWGEVIYVGEQ